MNATKRTWQTPAIEHLDLAATAGGPPGGPDAHAATGSAAGCNPVHIIAGCS